MNKNNVPGFGRLLTRMAIVMALSCTSMTSQAVEVSNFSDLQAEIVSQTANITVTGDINDFTEALTLPNGTNLTLGSNSLSAQTPKGYDGFIIRDISQVNITGGTLDSFAAAVNNAGTLKIEGTTFSAGSNRAIVNSGTITLNDAIVNAVSENTSGSIAMDGNVFNAEIINSATIHLVYSNKLNKISNAGGNIIVMGTGNTLNGTIDNGSVQINSTGGLVVQSGGKIDSSVELTSEGTLGVYGGTVDLNTGDTWTGTVILDSGTLNYSDLTSNGKIRATGGQLNLNSGTLNVTSDSSIASAVNVEVESGSVLNISGGNTALNTGDVWAGTINLTDGTLNYSNLTTNGKLNATGGKLNLNSGTLNIASGSSIDSAVNVELKSGAVLNVSGGNAALNTGDIWAGTINLTGGTLDYSDLTTNGILNATGGQLNLNSGTLNVLTTSSIESGAGLNIKPGSVLKISGGNAALNTGDVWAGTVNLTDGTLNYSDLTTNGTLTAVDGNLNLNSGTLNIASGSSIESGVDVNVKSGSVLNISGGNAALNSRDEWAGTINLTDGTLDYSDLVTNGKLNATGGSLNLNSGTLNLASGSSIADTVTLNVASGSILNISGGSTVFNDSDIWSGTVNLSSGTLNYGLSSNGALNATGGSFNINSGTFTIDSNVSIADAVAVNIASGGNLALQKNMTLSGNITGSGTLTNSGAALTLKAGSDNSGMSNFVQTSGSTTLAAGNTKLFSNTDLQGGTLTFNKGTGIAEGGSVSTSGSADKTIVISNNAGADTILNNITVGGSNVTMSLVASNSSKDLAVDGTAIKALDLNGNMTYSGNLSGAGTVNRGNVGTLNLSGDNSGFSGDFVQSGGTTNVTGKISSGNKNINAGNFNVTSTTLDYDNVKLGSNTKFTHTSTSQNGGSIGSQVSFTGSNATATFKGNGSTDYELTNENASASNTIAIDKSNVTLRDTNYNGKYSLTNSVLDLTTEDNTRSSSHTQEYDFTSLTGSGNTLNLNVDFVKDGGNVGIVSDTINTGSGTANFRLGSVKLYNEDRAENGGKSSYTTQVLKGGNSAFTNSSIAAAGASTVYNYLVNAVGQNITLNRNGFTDENSLNILTSETSGDRFFTFSGSGSETYHIGESLGKALGGNLSITGNGKTLSTISGAIVDEKGVLTGSKGSLFNISDEALNLSINNVKITDASGTNGSVVNVNNADSEVNINNTLLTGNTASANGGVVNVGANGGTVKIANSEVSNNSAANGGAIYNSANGTVEISNTTFTNNTASSNGGALYNAGSAKLDNVTFSAAESGNDVYNSGTITTSGKNTFNTDITNTNKLTLGGNNTVNGTLNNTAGELEFTGTNVVKNITGTGSASNSGNLALSGDASGFTGTFTQSEGTTTLNKDADFFGGTSTITGGTLRWLGNDISDTAVLKAEGGQLILGDGTNRSVLTVSGSNSTIAQAVQTVINNNSELVVTGGDIVMNNTGEGSDTWNGKISLTGGNLAVHDYRQDQRVTLNAQSGNLDVVTGHLTIANNSLIEEAVETNISSGTHLNVAGGTVTLSDKNDTWDGNLSLTSGVLNIEGFAKNGNINTNGGTLNLNKGRLNIGNGSEIGGATRTNIAQDTGLDIVKDGTATIGDDDKWDGEIKLTGGTLNYAASKSQDGSLEASEGNLNILGGAVLKIQVPSVIADEVNVDIQKNSLVEVTTDGHFNLDSADKWNGVIRVDNGNLKTTALSNNTSGGGGLQQLSGKSEFIKNSHIVINTSDSYIKGGEVYINDNSSLTIGNQTQPVTAAMVNISGNSLFSTMNNAIETTTIGDLVVDGYNTVNIDIKPRNRIGDNFVINQAVSPTVKGGVVAIDKFNFVGLAPIDRHFTMQIFDVGNINNVEFVDTDYSIFTPIGYYRLFSNGGGSYTARLTDYNPQVFRGQAATLAMWNNQLAINDILLNHVGLQSERLLAQGKNANKYAAALPQLGPYQYKQEDGGLWVKGYANFETLSMSQGLNVGNNAYGTIIGADFPVVDLENGWKFLPTAYISYNGAHQNFSHVSMTQNGGQGGFMGTFMKNDFIGSIVAYGGGYNNEMNVAGYTDNGGNWFAGTALKAAYNLHASKHFIVQPSALVSYNHFGKSRWSTDFGVMNMDSGMLNGVSVAPGVNLIYARETWSIYAALQYMFNINEQLGGHAGNVSLPNLSMRHGYFQYGFGLTKTWKDRLSSYGQITFRNGGRTGVGFQLGIQYLFDWYNPLKGKFNKANKANKASKQKAGK